MPESQRAALALVALLVAPAATRAEGFGPVRLGMTRAAAVAAAGPAALVGPLCGGAEGVLFPTAGGEAMAMFEAGLVTEMALTPLGDGAERAEDDCARTARLALDRLSVRHLPPATQARRVEAGIVEEVSRVTLPGGRVAAISRWSSSTTACWITLHWIAPSTTSRIRPE